MVGTNFPERVYVFYRKSILTVISAQNRAHCNAAGQVPQVPSPYINAEDRKKEKDGVIYE